MSLGEVPRVARDDSAKARTRSPLPNTTRVSSRNPFWGEGPRERTIIVQVGLCDPSAWVTSPACARDDGLWAKIPCAGGPFRKLRYRARLIAFCNIVIFLTNHGC